MINVFQPSLGALELDAVREVFDSNWLGKGRKTELFEQAFAKHLDVEAEQVISVSCCTEGLFQALEVLGIGVGDEVILPTISFVGAGNAVCAAGAIPVFCDVDRRTLNATRASIEAAITPRTKAVILIHYGGHPCEIEEISSLLRGKSIYLIEDSACSVSSRQNGRACGTFGDIGIWSFDAMKILVTGDGGMIFVNNPALRQQFERSTYLGLISKSGFTSAVDSKWWEFDISCFGRRAIVNDISSAIGLVQLARLPDFIARRQRIRDRYDELLADLEWLRVPPPVPHGATSSHYFYWVQVEEEAIRDRLANFLRSRGIYTTFRYYPLHWVKHYGSSPSLPDAEMSARNTLCLPMHQSLSDEEVSRVALEIEAFSKGA